jgi:putative DNA-invertase from lambdoid prophage Rac
MNVGYVRISRKDENLENQKEAIKKFAKGGLKFFEDTISGAVDPKERPEFQKMISYIVKNKPERVYMYEVSRLGRNMLETIQTFNWLEHEHGVMIFSVSPHESFLQIGDKSLRNLILSIFSWVAENERNILIERTRNAIELRKESLRVSGQFVSKAGRVVKKLGRPERAIDWDKCKGFRDKGVSWADISRIIEINYVVLLRKKKEAGINY